MKILGRFVGSASSMVYPANNDELRNGHATTEKTNSNPKGRRRALSIAEAQPTVETVVVKAKRAAQSLWMLLHAQNCVLAQKCPHTGCQEAKLLHLHIKTCSAGEYGECPMEYHGCDQSRKLLAHYRRCRSIRARQVQARSGSEAHHCLVCSLVARQARTMLDRKGSPPGAGSSSSSSSSKVPSCVKRPNSASRKAAPSSYVLSASAADILVPERRPSMAKMPPPPPRTGVSPPTDSLARLYETAKQMDEEPKDRTTRQRAVSDADTMSTLYKASLLQDEDNKEPRRERSASCGTAPVFSTSHKAGGGSSPPTCDTIIEEEANEASTTTPELTELELPAELAHR